MNKKPTAKSVAFGIPINGRESSLLALLAQIVVGYKGINPKKHVAAVLECLEREESTPSYRIGCLICSIEVTEATNQEKSIARGFLNWAKNQRLPKSSKRLV